MKDCRSCKYFGKPEGAATTVCFLKPPLTAVFPTQGALGVTAPAVMSYRPAVQDTDYTCIDFHEIFHNPGIP